MKARHLRGMERPITASHNVAETGRVHQFLLSAGILAPVLYVAMTLFVGMLWEGYSTASQTISELSAIDAPTRRLWVLLGAVYSLLLVGFGWAVWKSAPPNRALRIVGALLMTQAVFASTWPPMHQRAVLADDGGTLTDTLHIVWTVVSGLFFMVTMGFGAAAFGGRFRRYSIATMAVGLACGLLTGRYASRIEADLPTPWVGVWERLSAGVYMLWIAVLASVLLRASRITRWPTSASARARAPERSGPSDST